MCNSPFVAATQDIISSSHKNSDTPIQPLVGTEFDREIMQRCLQLARLVVGYTSPNPLVGAVVVKDGKIVGEGFHPGAGEPHAEVFALRDAGEQAHGATMYVNLEPCNHYGRTPPCSEALIKAGVAKVVVGMVDPNPLVSGRGIVKLQAAGVDVLTGVEEADCRLLNEGFIHRVLHHKPFGILKYAMTLDGKIATSSGHSTWVTNDATRQAVHRLRSACDAVIIGGNTVRQDNPHLTNHGQGNHSPLRVVMSRHLNLPSSANLWNTDNAQTVVLTKVGANPEFQALLYRQGVEVVELEPLTPNQVMTYFYNRGFCKVLWECGGILAANAIAQGAVQKVLAFIAPKIIGGVKAPGPVGNLGFTTMNEALSLQCAEMHVIGSDFLITGYLPKH